MDIRQSPHHAEYLKAIGWRVAYVPSHDGLQSIAVYILRFPFGLCFAKVQRYSKTPNVQHIQQLFNQHHVFSCSFEPDILSETESAIHNTFVKALGLHKDKQVFIPTKTLHLDLTQSIDQLRAQFNENARRLTRPHMHQDLVTTITPLSDLSEQDLKQFWHDGKKANKHWYLTWSLFSKLALQYKDHAHLAITSSAVSGTPLSGVLLLHTNDCLNYFQAWTSAEGRKRHAHFWTTLKILEYGKKLGCTIFDFEGLEDERYPHPSWRGFSTFKIKFGGKVIMFPGCFSRMKWTFWTRW